MVAAGAHHTVLLRSDGMAVAFGLNTHGQCEVPALSGDVTYTQVAAGLFHTVLLRSDGIAVAFGLNGKGQCDLPERGCVHIAAWSDFTVLLASDGVGWSNDMKRARIPDMVGDESYSHVAKGLGHTVLLRNDGKCIAIGENGTGQCDIPALSEDVKYTQVVAGVSHTVLIRSDGSTAACGDNAKGQCNIPALPGARAYRPEVTGVVYTQAAAGGAHTALLRSDGTVVACGDNSCGQCNIPVDGCSSSGGLTYIKTIVGRDDSIFKCTFREHREKFLFIRLQEVAGTRSGPKKTFLERLVVHDKHGKTLANDKFLFTFSEENFPVEVFLTPEAPPKS